MRYGYLQAAILHAIRQRPQTVDELVISLYGRWDERLYRNVTSGVQRLIRKSQVTRDRSSYPSRVIPVSPAVPSHESEE